MTHRPTHLIDASSTKVAVLDVRFHDGHFEGAISLDATPPHLQQLFEQFEEIVEGQMFSLLDEIEEKIGTVALRAVFDDGSEAQVADLQIFPRTRAVSFTTRQLAAAR